MDPSPAAVLWDFGGVISTSPFDSFTAFEARHGLPEGLIRGLNATNSDTNAWAALERGEVDIDGFATRFEAEAAEAGAVLDARALLASLGGDLRPEMAEAVRRCHEHLKTALLTNNFTPPESSGFGLEAYDGLMGSFDVVLESSRAGCRKPDRRFYQMACDMLGIDPSEAVFLDDLGVNLKPARAMGMTTIKVTDPIAALEELEKIVGFDLLD